MNNLIVTIDLKGYQPLGCLLPGGNLLFAQAQGPVVRLLLDGKELFLLDSLLVRADSYSVERIYQAGLLLLALIPHHAAFARLGFDEDWRKAFKDDLELMYSTWHGEEGDRHLAEVDRRVEAPREARAREIVSRFLQLVQAAGLRDWFNTVSADRQSLPGLTGALREIGSKVKSPTIREALLRAGVTDDLLQEIDELQKALHGDRSARAEAQAQALVDTAPLRAAKALIVGEISRASNVARAELPGSQWEPFQVSRLLDLPRPAAGRVEPPPPVPPAGPTPPVLGGPLPPAGPTPPVLGGPTPPAGGPTPPPLAGPASPPAGFSLPTPGTLIATLPGQGGPAVHGFLQPDGTVRWVPDVTAAAATSFPAGPPQADVAPATPAVGRKGALPAKRTGEGAKGARPPRRSGRR